MAGVNFRQERYSEVIIYDNSIAGPGPHLNIALTRNRYNSYTRLNLDYNEFKSRFKKASSIRRFYSDEQIAGITTFTLGISRGTYLRSPSDGRRLLSLEAGLDLSFSNFTSSVTEYLRDEASNGALQITGYSLGSFPLVHIALGTSVRVLGHVYWDVSVVYYQGLVRMYQYSYDFRNWMGYDGYTEHTSNGSYLAFRTGINMALVK